MFKFLTFVIFAISATSTYSQLFFPEPSQTAGEIVGKIDDAPFVTSIYINRELVCGAVIINDYFVLTAAACIKTRNTSAYTIRAGSLSHNYGGSIHYVNAIIVHKDFHINQYNLPVNDIALIKVNQQFQFNGQRDALPIYPRRFVDSTSTGKIYGWGVRGSQLRKGSVYIYNTRNCNAFYQGKLPNGQICAIANSSKTPCKNDAGGPFVIGVHLVGIISWGKNCDLDGTPDVYTDVNFYRDWIDGNMKEFYPH
ncbi:trypsin 3A1-like [Leptopilina boulardi]|uniref:trypsin 3A1-like n=1 Tax=Leptopilina boulardi TaxID=63433 RepID=UPI0021F54B82|nr:trypsin 3A1-like [Leptopilina boulardi]